MKGIRSKQKAGCVPLRMKSDRDPKQVLNKTNSQVLLTNSSKRAGRLVLPKGSIKPTETPLQAALRECWEETGCTGKVGQEITMISTFVDREGAVDQEWSVGEDCKWWLLCVQEEHKDYPEKFKRQKYWCDLSEAINMSNVKKGQRKVLEAAYHLLPDGKSDGGGKWCSLM